MSGWSTDIACPPTDDRFWAMVDKSGTCWVWTGCKRNGYGRLNRNGRVFTSHRVAYEALRSPIPAGMVLDHLCCNKACVNPDHLEVVSQVVNAQRGIAVRTECPQGHPYTDSNSYVRSDGRKLCRTCRADRRKDEKARQRERFRTGAGPGKPGRPSKPME